MGNYNNDYRSEHSNHLRKHFMISNRGVDYYNLNNVSFEFKESFIERRESIFFKIPKKQLDESSFIVFNVCNEEYYIVRSSEFLMRYSFKNCSERCCSRLNVVKNLSFYRTDNLNNLEKFINGLTVNDI